MLYIPLYMYVVCELFFVNGIHVCCILFHIALLPRTMHNPYPPDIHVFLPCRRSYFTRVAATVDPISNYFPTAISTKKRNF